MKKQKLGLTSMLFLIFFIFNLDLNIQFCMFLQILKICHPKFSNTLASDQWGVWKFNFFTVLSILPSRYDGHGDKLATYCMYPSKSIGPADKNITRVVLALPKWRILVCGMGMTGPLTEKMINY